MQVAVQPEVGARQQVVVGVAEARRAAARAVARVGALHARREMGDDDGPVPAVARPLQLGFEPGAAGERLGAHRVDVERPPAPGRLHQVHEIGAGAHRLGATAAPNRSKSLQRVVPTMRMRAPAASATTRLSRSSIVMPRLGAARAQRRQRVVEVAAVELVVAGDEDDRLRPAAKALERGPARCRCRRRAPAARRRAPARGRRLGLEVQVGEELQPHQAFAAPAAPWHCLNLRPLPHGHGSLRPTLGASRGGPSRPCSAAARSARRARRRRRRPRRSRRRAWRAAPRVATSRDQLALVVALRPAGSGTAAPTSSRPPRRRARRARERCSRLHRSRRPRAAARARVASSAALRLRPRRRRHRVGSTGRPPRPRRPARGRTDRSCRTRRSSGSARHGGAG